MRDLLDYNSWKTDKHMRDTEAFMGTKHFEPATKMSHTMVMKNKYNTDKRPHKARTKLDINKDFLVEGDGFVPDNFKAPVESFSQNCDAHYKYGLL